MFRILVPSFVALAAFSPSLAQAQVCRNCVETVAVRPARAVVAPVVVRPAVVASTAPASFARLDEVGVFEPARRVRRTFVDSRGRVVQGWVTVPAILGVRHRNVAMQPFATVTPLEPVVAVGRPSVLVPAPTAWSLFGPGFW